nr:cuticlin-2-like [Equus caballus]
MGSLRGAASPSAGRSQLHAPLPRWAETGAGSRAPSRLPAPHRPPGGRGKVGEPGGGRGPASRREAAPGTAPPLPLGAPPRPPRARARRAPVLRRGVPSERAAAAGGGGSGPCARPAGEEALGNFCAAPAARPRSCGPRHRRHANNSGGPPIGCRDGRGLHQSSPRGAATMQISLRRGRNPVVAEAGPAVEEGRERASRERGAEAREGGLDLSGPGRHRALPLPAVQALGGYYGKNARLRNVPSTGLRSLHLAERAS